MSFRFVKENDDKVVNATSYDLDNQDDFTIKKTMLENPETMPEKNDQLGEDFLIHKDYVQDDNDDQPELDREPEDNIFFKENVSEAGEKMSYEEIQQQKSHYLYQLNRLRKRGIESTRRFGMEHSLDEIRGEVFRIKKEIHMDNSIDYCRQGLMFCVSTIEMANGQYNLGGKLNGLSQSIMANIESYDDVFEELSDKYYTNMQVAPEIKLIAMISGSVFMFHMQNTLLNNESIARKQRDMTGPEMDTDALLNELNEVDLDDVSSIASSEKSLKIIELEQEEKKSIPLKKRGGRPRKNKQST